MRRLRREKKGIPMTLRKAVNFILDSTDEFDGHMDTEEEKVEQSLAIIFHVLRTVEQGEKATDEGVEESWIAFQEMYGQPTRQKVLDFMRGDAFDTYFPDKVFLEMITLE
jgi:hypothetical protein